MKYLFHSRRSQTEREVLAQEVKLLWEEDHKDSHPTWCYSQTKQSRQTFAAHIFIIILLKL